MDKAFRQSIGGVGQKDLGEPASPPRARTRDIMEYPNVEEKASHYHSFQVPDRPRTAVAYRRNVPSNGKEEGEEEEDLSLTIEDLPNYSTSRTDGGSNRVLESDKPLFVDRVDDDRKFFDESHLTSSSDALTSAVDCTYVRPNLSRNVEVRSSQHHISFEDLQDDSDKGRSAGNAGDLNSTERTVDLRAATSPIRSRSVSFDASSNVPVGNDHSDNLHSPRFEPPLSPRPLPSPGRGMLSGNHVMISLVPEIIPIAGLNHGVDDYTISNNGLSSHLHSVGVTSRGGGRDGDNLRDVSVGNDHSDNLHSPRFEPPLSPRPHPSPGRGMLSGNHVMISLVPEIIPTAGLNHAADSTYNNCSTMYAASMSPSSVGGRGRDGEHGHLPVRKTSFSESLNTITYESSGELDRQQARTRLRAQVEKELKRRENHVFFTTDAGAALPNSVSQDDQGNENEDFIEIGNEGINDMNDDVGDVDDLSRTVRPRQVSSAARVREAKKDREIDEDEEEEDEEDELASQSSHLHPSSHPAFGSPPVRSDGSLVLTSNAALNGLILESFDDIVSRYTVQENTQSSPSPISIRVPMPVLSAIHGNDQNSGGWDGVSEERNQTSLTELGRSLNTAVNTNMNASMSYNIRDNTVGNHLISGKFNNNDMNYNDNNDDDGDEDGEEALHSSSSNFKSFHNVNEEEDRRQRILRESKYLQYDRISNNRVKNNENARYDTDKIIKEENRLNKKKKKNVKKEERALHTPKYVTEKFEDMRGSNDFKNCVGISRSRSLSSGPSPVRRKNIPQSSSSPASKKNVPQSSPQVRTRIPSNVLLENQNKKIGHSSNVHGNSRNTYSLSPGHERGKDQGKKGVMRRYQPTATQGNNTKNVRTVPQEGNKRKVDKVSSRDYRLNGTQEMEGTRQNLSVFLPSPSPSSSQKIERAHGQMDELELENGREKEGEGEEGDLKGAVTVPVSLTVRSPSHSMTQMQSPSQRRTLLLRRAAENASRVKERISNENHEKELPRVLSLNSMENVPCSNSDVMLQYSDIYNSNQNINDAQDEGEWLLDRNRNRLHLRQYHIETEYDENDDENEEENEEEGDTDDDSLNCADLLGHPTRHSRLRPRSAKGRIRSPGSGSGSGSRTVTPPFLSPTNVNVLKVVNDDGVDIWERKPFQKSDGDKRTVIQSESIKNREKRTKSENQDDNGDGEKVVIEVEGSVLEDDNDDNDDVGTGCTNEAFIGTLSALNRSPSRGPIPTDGPISCMTSPSYSLYSKKSFQPSLRAGLQEPEYKIEDISKYIHLLQSQSHSQSLSNQLFYPPSHLSHDGGLSQSLKEAIRESVEGSFSKLLGISFQDLIKKKEKGKKIIKKRNQKDSQLLAEKEIEKGREKAARMLSASIKESLTSLKKKKKILEKNIPEKNVPRKGFSIPPKNNIDKNQLQHLKIDNDVVLNMESDSENSEGLILGRNPSTKSQNERMKNNSPNQVPESVTPLQERLKKMRRIADDREIEERDKERMKRKEENREREREREGGRERKGGKEKRKEVLISVLKDSGGYVKRTEFFKSNDNSHNISNYNENDNNSDDIQMRSSITYYNANVNNNNNYNKQNKDNSYDKNDDYNNMIFNSPNFALPHQDAVTKKYSDYEKEKVKKIKKKILKK